MVHGLILFAHGSREPGWAEPFEHLAARVRVVVPEAQVRLAFLELMQPDLEGAAAQLVSAGVDTIRVVPIFLGQGGHLRRDLPLLIDDLRAQFPRAKFGYAPAAGEDAGVLDAIAAYCGRQLKGG
ncbi:MAG: CbiX/SirB N-terminal domain-containing protein [Pseudomonadota bacterium]|nr:CbiX/SirB N-terminal domain-containing protein [Pseudomonadota bacterium]